MCTDYKYVVITGDFNFHMDVEEDHYTKELSNFLDTFGLSQFIKQKTHKLGHILDLISKDVGFNNINVLDLAVSDHFCVFFDIDTVSNYKSANSNNFSKRHIKDNTAVQFIEKVSKRSSTCRESADELLESFTLKISNALDTVAPLKIKNKKLL